MSAFCEGLFDVIMTGAVWLIFVLAIIAIGGAFRRMIGL